MSAPSSLHPTLARQVRRAGLDEGDVRLRPLLDRVSRSYFEADQERYTTERSLEVVSREMHDLYENLRTRTDAIHAATIEAATAGVLVVDEARRILSFNRAFLDVWRLDRQIVPGSAERDVLGDALSQVADPQAFLARVQERYAAPSASARDEVLMADGRVLDRHTAPVVDAAGRVLGRVWFFHDVTDAKRYQQELREARDAAEQASQTKSAFLANMSHELRTPLNSILGFGRLLEDAALDEGQREDLRLILSAGEHMLTLVNDLLDLRSVEEGGHKLEREPLAVGPLFDEAFALVKPLASDRGHQVTFEIEPGLPAALGDRRAVVQVLVNLISNAAKFTPRGGTIAILARRLGARVEVAVKDSGIGIAPEARGQIFTYYTQLDAKAEHGMKGSGIGLALTRALVTKLGGDIGVESVPGVGSTFRFTLEAAA